MSNARAPQDVTKEDNSLQKSPPTKPPFSYFNEELNPEADKTTRIKPNNTLVCANFHLDLVKTKPDNKKIRGAANFVQPSNLSKKSLQNAKEEELVKMATVETTAKDKAVSDPIAVIVLCLSLSLGNL